MGYTIFFLVITLFFCLIALSLKLTGKKIVLPTATTTFPKTNTTTLAWVMFGLALLINFPAFFKGGFWGLWAMGPAKIFLIAATFFLLVVIWKHITEMMWYGILIFGVIVFVHQRFFADELVERHTLQPGEIWESSIVDYKYRFRAEPGRDYLVKFNGCDTFVWHRSLENEGTQPPPHCAKAGRIKIKLDTSDKEPLEIKLYKRR